MPGKMVMMKGLPASGKSAFCEAERLKDPRRVAVVTKDQIRFELKRPWSHDVEKEVLKMRDRQIEEGLSAGKTVYSADTNLAPKHETRLRELARKYKAVFEIKSFLDVPLEVCLERDAAREVGDGQVGKDVIMGMYNQFLKPVQKTEPYVDDHSLPTAVICDLDGTLCLHNGRSPYEYEKCDTDLLNRPVWTIIDFYSREGKAQIIYLSGREDVARQKTAEWLETHKCPPGRLYMRTVKDFRKDTIVKLELFNEFIRGKFRVEFVLDDRPVVLRQWREMGLTTLQVGDGHEF